MLTAFFKGETETTAVCRIVKYTDLIFLPRTLRLAFPKSSEIEVLRLVCLEVTSASPVPVHRLFMACPTYVARCEDVSDLLLENGTVTRSATTWGVRSLNNREVEWDGIKSVRIAKKVTVANSRVGTGAVLELSFDERVQPGAFIGFALRLVMSNRTNTLTLFRRELRLKYFLGPGQLATHLELIAPERHVPCLSYYAGNPTEPRVSGGFDSVICYPRSLKATASPSATAGIIGIDATGKRMNAPRSIALWRLRYITNEQVVMPRTREVDLILDIEISPTIPMYLLSVFTSAILALLFGVFVVPYLRLKLGL